jgi:prepilin-type processing-associated H-X9-DG protein
MRNPLSARAQGLRIRDLLEAAGGCRQPQFGPVRALGAPSHGNSGFTLIETLVAFAMVLTLAALSIPATRKTADYSRRVQCVSNLRQLAQAVHLYAGDHAERLPAEAEWMQCVAPYVGQPPNAANLDTLGVFRCPAGWISGARSASNQQTYWYNCHSLPFAETPAISPTGINAYYYSFPSLNLFQHPAQTIILSCWWFYLWSGNWTTPPSDTHQGGRPVAYLDGHVVVETAAAYFQNGGPPMSAISQY